MNIDLENFFWHDGNITSLNYLVKKTGVSLEIEGEFYASQESKNRANYDIICNKY